MVRSQPSSSSDARIGVVGASGFVGSAVVAKLQRQHSCTVVKIAAPRVEWRNEGPEHLLVTERLSISDLASEFAELDAVVNCAGFAIASSRNASELWNANCATAAVFAAAARTAGIPRVVHISSAAVQGRSDVLDSSSLVKPENSYGDSKACGEEMVRALCPGAVVYRPPGVHGSDRDVTRRLVRLAGSRLSSVAAPGDGNAPQALIENVASAIAFLLMVSAEPPSVVSHPSEGLSTAELLELIGGRVPREVPRGMARMLLSLGFGLPFKSDWMYAQLRRLEVLWFGQVQASSWLTEAGWQPDIDKAGWSNFQRYLE